MILLGCFSRDISEKNNGALKTQARAAFLPLNARKTPVDLNFGAEFLIQRKLAPKIFKLEFFFFFFKMF